MEINPYIKHIDICFVCVYIYLYHFTFENRLLLKQKAHCNVEALPQRMYHFILTQYLPTHCWENLGKGKLTHLEWSQLKWFFLNSTRLKFVIPNSSISLLITQENVTKMCYDILNCTILSNMCSLSLMMSYK